MEEHTQEWYRQRTLDRVKEWKETIPGFREEVLEQIIEREMFMKASRYNSDLDYQERCKKIEETQSKEHVIPFKCVCSKIKKLFS